MKDGECLAVWDAKGDYKTFLGPQRVWLQFSRVQFMNRHIADAHQYLEIRYRSGKKEHKRGPLALFEDPVMHESVEVCSAVTVDAFETIVVYEEGEEGEVKRNLITGPTVFVPSTNQWLHIFKVRFLVILYHRACHHMYFIILPVTICTSPSCLSPYVLHHHSGTDQPHMDLRITTLWSLELFSSPS